MARICAGVAFATALLCACLASAQVDAAARPAVETSEPATVERDEDSPEPFTIGGWVEAYYAFNFNEPSNGITDLRGFDNRHNSFNLSNVVLDAQWDWEGVNGRITLQWGSTPATYYLSETTGPSLGSGVGAQSIELWQFVQQAFVGYRIPVGTGLNVQAGLFLHPIGVESMAVKDDWLYSRTNLFFGYPFYHTGFRISYEVIPGLGLNLWLVNGWNTVLDDNDEKTVIAHATFDLGERFTGAFSYTTGVERPDGAPEGRAWRHTFDLNGTVALTEWLALQGQATGGFEPNAFGTSGYAAGMLAVRVSVIEWLSFAARGDFFWERVASDASGTASPIFWPVEWVSSATIGADVHPHDHVSLRLEYRHDEAAGDAYFAGEVIGNGTTEPFVRNAASQNTITVGATAWF
ncbi:outer membrane beta-barrel protein [Sandaracinus amylolyticus]|uniref:outer membrane beta-barrel protein n=1 Tax=Sandaracinus amylolyticus TaxID=927083 RepID=UPI00069F3A73|nr:outer membrane beta-barrel protein [Sandaracinus amylolyticus]